MDLTWKYQPHSCALYDGVNYRGIVYKLKEENKWFVRAYSKDLLKVEEITHSSKEAARAWLYTVVRLGD